MNYDEIDKIRGCWTGKCLGGVAGMPYEGVPEPPNLTEDGIVLNNVPNDDLEMQLVWMTALEKHGLAMREKEFGETWLEHIPHGCDEYCVAERNLRRGIFPPASGWKDNFFVDGMGATIRSEIWALLLADRPDAVAFFAGQDAQVDHWGDGVWGEIFLAVAEALAFASGKVEESLRRTLGMISPDCKIHRALARVFQLYDSHFSLAEARNDLMLTIQRSDNFSDCVMNITFIVFALLWGKGDFIRTILLAVNFGRDTDCTGASCGAFLGIAFGLKVFPEKWLSAVEEHLALSDYVREIPGIPTTMTELVEKTVALRQQFRHQMPDEPYPQYVPYSPEKTLPSQDSSRWLILKNCQTAEDIEVALRQSGTLPEELQNAVIDFPGLILNLSEYAGNACTLDLFTFLTVTEENTTPPEDIVICVAADVGLTFWMDGHRLLNHHSRRKMIPAFHRTEGGASFACPLHNGEKHLLHLRLYSCLPPLQACVMFGNVFNDHLEGFKLSL